MMGCPKKWDSHTFGNPGKAGVLRVVVQGGVS